MHRVDMSYVHFKEDEFSHAPDHVGKSLVEHYHSDNRSIVCRAQTTLKCDEWGAEKRATGSHWYSIVWQKSLPLQPAFKPDDHVELLHREED